MVPSCMPARRQRLLIPAASIERRLQTQDHVERDDARAVGVGNAETLVLEPGTDVTDVCPRPHAQANSVPRSEKEIRLAGPAIPTVLPSDCQRARPAFRTRRGRGPESGG